MRYMIPGRPHRLAVLIASFPFLTAAEPFVSSSFIEKCPPKINIDLGTFIESHVIDSRLQTTQLITIQTTSSFKVSISVEPLREPFWPYRSIGT